MLCGHPAFHPNKPRDIVNGSYFSMDSAPWKNVTPEAKDLVKRMLTKDYRSRISLNEVPISYYLSKSFLDIYVDIDAPLDNKRK